MKIAVSEFKNISSAIYDVLCNIKCELETKSLEELKVLGIEKEEHWYVINRDGYYFCFEPPIDEFEYFIVQGANRRKSGKLPSLIQSCTETSVQLSVYGCEIDGIIYNRLGVTIRKDGTYDHGRIPDDEPETINHSIAHVQTALINDFSDFVAIEKLKIDVDSAKAKILELKNK